MSLESLTLRLQGFDYSLLWKLLPSKLSGIPSSFPEVKHCKEWYKNDTWFLDKNAHKVDKFTSTTGLCQASPQWGAGKSASSSQGLADDTGQIGQALSVTPAQNGAKFGRAHYRFTGDSKRIVEEFCPRQLQGEMYWGTGSSWSAWIWEDTNALRSLEALLTSSESLRLICHAVTEQFLSTLQTCDTWTRTQMPAEVCIAKPWVRLGRSQPTTKVDKNKIERHKAGASPEVASPAGIMVQFAFPCLFRSQTPTNIDAHTSCLAVLDLLTSQNLQPCKAFWSTLCPKLRYVSLVINRSQKQCQIMPIKQFGYQKHALFLLCKAQSPDSVQEDNGLIDSSWIHTSISQLPE